MESPTPVLSESGWKPDAPALREYLRNHSHDPV